MASGEIDIIPGRVLSAEELVDNSKLNDLGLPVARVKAAAVTAREIADGSITSDKLDVNLEAQIGVADGSITTAKIVDDAVTASKIADDLITAQTALLLLDAGDLLLVWDASASSYKKIDITNVLPAGSILQSVQTRQTTYTTTTSTIPVDDSIPQVGEGAQLLTRTITPRYANSIIRARFTAQCASNQDFQSIVFALFRDAVANALGAQMLFLHDLGAFEVAAFEVDDSPASTSLLTYQIRWGRVNSSGSGSAAVNGWSGGSGRYLGGSQGATLTLEEIKV